MSRLGWGTDTYHLKQEIWGIKSYLESKINQAIEELSARIDDIDDIAMSIRRELEEIEAFLRSIDILPNLDNTIGELEERVRTAERKLNNLEGEVIKILKELSYIDSKAETITAEIKEIKNILKELLSSVK